MGELDERTKALVSAITLLAVNLLALFGVQLNHDAVWQVVAAVAVIVSTAYGIWKNHNFTPEAAQAQQYLDLLKEKSANDAKHMREGD
jgi:uncharacterized membrane protein